MRVNALLPVQFLERIWTKTRRSLAEGRSVEEIARDNYTEVAALKRWVYPDEVARAALYLASISAPQLQVIKLRLIVAVLISNNF